MSTTATSRAEHARYLGAIPDALWRRMSAAERRTFTDGTLDEIRALSKELGIVPRAPKPAQSINAALNAISTITRHYGPAVGARAAEILTRTTPAQTPTVEDVKPAIAQAMGLVPKHDFNNGGAIHYPALDPANANVKA